MSRNVSPRRILPWVAIAATSVFFSACEHFSSPQNTFAPAGKVAEGQKSDFLLVTFIALPIMILVLVACVAIPIMFRRKKGDPGLPKQIHGNTALELTWTIIPVFLLAIIAVPTVAGIRDLGREPSDEALEVRVEAFRFSWQFFYREIKVGDEELESLPDDDSDQRPVLRIPVDREIAIRLISKDVNHSFWVPKLAGKTDVIQNHENKMWILATEPGLFEAQCAEFCGLSHSDMRFRVEAMPEAEFNAWVEEQGGVETLGSADSTAADDNEVEGTPGPVTPPPTDAIILDDNFVHLQGQSEENPTITVPSGKTVAVVNEGAALHNLQVSPFESAICTLDDPSPCSDPPRISGGDEGTITFDIPAGNYEYRCDFHPVEMTGTLVVGPPEPTGSDEPAPGGVASDSEAEEPAGD